DHGHELRRGQERAGEGARVRVEPRGAALGEADACRGHGLAALRRAGGGVMNITIAKRDLLRIAARAAAVAERKSTMPMLAMTLLTARKSSLRASATDLYTSITDAASADIKAPGSIAVNAADLLARVKSLPEGPVELSTKDNALTIKAKGAARRFTLRTAPANDYPPLATPREDAPVLTIEAAVLSKIFALTHFSISPDESRPHLAS